VNNPSHLSAVLKALLVTFLWSTSFVIIKLGLEEMSPLTFAGLRYVLASIFLIPFALKRKTFQEIREIDGKNFFHLLILGILFYTITQGAQFAGLSLLPAVTVSLMLNFTPLIVLILAAFFLKEFPALNQMGGMGIFLLGIIIYFFPISFSVNEALGLAIISLGVISNALSSVAGRSINMKGNISPLGVTIISMSAGSILLLIAGIIVEGFPSISFKNFLYLIWLSLINTSFAFTLWNSTLRQLTAVQSSIINGTMLVQIALLAWIFLGEEISSAKIIGMLLASGGAILVQLKFSPKQKSLEKVE
jgi:drug/metabolite transporter (DMT)-like permease